MRDCCLFKGGGLFGRLLNHSGGKVEFDQGGFFSFTHWENLKGGLISLYGPDWRFIKEPDQRTSRSLLAPAFINAATIAAEEKLIYSHPDPHQGTWEAETLIYQHLGKTLIPVSLKGLKASYLDVQTTNFNVLETTSLSIPHLVLRLTGSFTVEKDFITPRLEVFTPFPFKLGQSNESMTTLATTEGSLSLQAYHIDARYGKIFGTGDTVLKATRDWIQSGAAKQGDIVKVDFLTGLKEVWATTNNAPVGSFGDNTVDYRKVLSNGAYIASNSTLTLSAPELFLKGEIFSKGSLKLEGSRQIHASLTKIQALGDISIETPLYRQDRQPLVSLQSPANRVYFKTGTGNTGTCLTLLPDTPPLLQSTDAISFKAKTVENIGGSVLAGKTLSLNNKVVAGLKQSFTGAFRNESVPQYQTVWLHWEGRSGNFIHPLSPALASPPARIIAGQTISIETGTIQLTGMTSGHQIGLKANTFTARNVGTKTIPLNSSLTINLANYGKQVYGSTGFIKALPDGRITTDIPLSGGLKPTLSQQLYVTDEVMPQPSLNPNPSQQFLIDPVPLQLMVQQALAQYGGTLNVKGRSGEALNQYLLENAEELIKKHGSALLSKKILQDYPKSLLAFEMDKNRRASALLALGQEEINQYQQSSDIHADTTVDIHTTKSQQHIGNRVVGKEGITLTSEGTLEAASTVMSNRTYEGKKTVTRESIEHLQQFLSNGDIHLAATEGITLTGSEIRAGRDITLEGGTVNIAGIVLKETSTETTKKKGLTSSQWKYEHSSTPTFQQALLAAAGKIHFTKKTGKATLAGTVIQGQTLVNETTEGMTLKPIVGVQQQIVHTKQKNPFSGVTMKGNQGQEVLCPSVLAVGEVLTENSPLTLVSVDWDREKTRINGMYEEAIQQLKSWNHVEIKKSGVPPEALAVAAVAFTVLTAGTSGPTLFSTLQGFMTGSTTLGEVAATTMTMLGRAVGARLITNGGNVEATLKQTFSKESFKTLAVSLAAEGILGSMEVAAPESYAPISQIAAYEAQKALVNAGVSTAFRQQKLKDALKGAGINFISSVMGRTGAEVIGKTYGEGNLGFIEHKALHGLLGAGTGALRGDTLAGALGGMVGEIVADSFGEKKEIIAARVEEKAKKQGIEWGTKEYDALIEQEVKPLMDWSKVAAVTITALAKHDINIGLKTATNALEYNFLQTLAAGVIKYLTKQGIKEVGKEVAKNITKTPVGRSGNILKVTKNNVPTTIDGTKFTGHALDQMQSRGIISPSAVIDVVKNPVKILHGNTQGTTTFIKDNLKVVTNKNGDIITVIHQ